MHSKMQWFVFFFFYPLLLTVVRPIPINDKSKLWPTNRTLTWKLNRNNSLGDSPKTRQDIRQAFDDWARYSKLTFREVMDGEKADFNLAFVSGDHSDGYPFDGPDGQLAHAFSPGNDYAGLIHFDSTEEWSHKYDGTGKNLRLVAAHVIGHSLGLPHSFEDDSIMFPVYQVILPNKMLPKPDQYSIQLLYGKKENPVTTARRNTRVRSTTTKQTKTMKKQTTTMK